MEEVKNIKSECLSSPHEKLWVTTRHIPELKNIFYHLKSLEYIDRPDYELIRNNLKSIVSSKDENP